MSPTSRDSSRNNNDIVVVQYASNYKTDSSTPYTEMGFMI